MPRHPDGTTPCRRDAANRQTQTERCHRINPRHELRVHAANVLADYKVPERILLIAEIPKGLTGKVDRRRLRAILIAQTKLGE